MEMIAQSEITERQLTDQDIIAMIVADIGGTNYLGVITQSVSPKL